MRRSPLVQKGSSRTPPSPLAPRQPTTTRAAEMTPARPAVSISCQMQSPMSAYRSHQAPQVASSSGGGEHDGNTTSPDEPLTVNRTQLGRPRARRVILSSDDESETAPSPVRQASPDHSKLPKCTTPKGLLVSLTPSHASAYRSPRRQPHQPLQPLQNVTNTLQPPGAVAATQTASGVTALTLDGERQPAFTHTAVGDELVHLSGMCGGGSAAGVSKPGILELAAMLRQCSITGEGAVLGTNLASSRLACIQDGTAAADFRPSAAVTPGPGCLGDDAQLGEPGCPATVGAGLRGSHTGAGAQAPVPGQGPGQLAVHASDSGSDATPIAFSRRVPRRRRKVLPSDDEAEDVDAAAARVAESPPPPSASQPGWSQAVSSQPACGPAGPVNASGSASSPTSSFYSACEEQPDPVTTSLSVSHSAGDDDGESTSGGKATGIRGPASDPGSAAEYPPAGAGPSRTPATCLPGSADCADVGASGASGVGLLGGPDDGVGGGGSNRSSSCAGPGPTAAAVLPASITLKTASMAWGSSAGPGPAGEASLLAKVPRRRQGLRSGRDVIGEALEATGGSASAAAVGAAEAPPAPGCRSDSDGLMYDLYGELLLESHLRGLSLDELAGEGEEEPSQHDADLEQRAVWPPGEFLSEEEAVLGGGPDAPRQSAAVEPGAASPAAPPLPTPATAASEEVEVMDLTFLSSSSSDDGDDDTDEDSSDGGSASTGPASRDDYDYRLECQQRGLADGRHLGWPYDRPAGLLGPRQQRGPASTNTATDSGTSTASVSGSDPAGSDEDGGLRGAEASVSGSETTSGGVRRRRGRGSPSSTGRRRRRSGTPPHGSLQHPEADPGAVSAPGSPDVAPSTRSPDPESSLDSGSDSEPLICRRTAPPTARRRKLVLDSSSDGSATPSPAPTPRAGPGPSNQVPAHGVEADGSVRNEPGPMRTLFLGPEEAADDPYELPQSPTDGPASPRGRGLATATGGRGTSGGGSSSSGHGGEEQGSDDDDDYVELVEEGPGGAGQLPPLRICGLATPMPSRPPPGPPKLPQPPPPPPLLLLRTPAQGGGGGGPSQPRRRGGGGSRTAPPKTRAVADSRLLDAEAEVGPGDRDGEGGAEVPRSEKPKGGRKGGHEQALTPATAVPPRQQQQQQRPRLPAAQREFLKARQRIAQELYDRWNGAVFDGRLPADLPIVWNPRLTSTAGQVVAQPELAGVARRIPAKLELSCRLIDSLEKLRSTLAHEMCHVAAWHLSHEYHPPHGPAWSHWGAVFCRHDPSLVINRTHDYIESYPHRWRCSRPGCGKEYGRQRKTIRVGEHTCAECHSQLVYLGYFDRHGNPRPARGVGPAGEGVEGGQTSAAAKKPPNVYALFVKENFSAVKQSLPPRTPNSVVYKQLSQLYNNQKARKSGAVGTGGGAGAGPGSPAANITTFSITNRATPSPRGSGRRRSGGGDGSSGGGGGGSSGGGSGRRVDHRLARAADELLPRMGALSFAEAVEEDQEQLDEGQQ